MDLLAFFSIFDTLNAEKDSIAQKPHKLRNWLLHSLFVLFISNTLKNPGKVGALVIFGKILWMLRAKLFNPCLRDRIWVVNGDFNNF